MSTREVIARFESERKAWAAVLANTARLSVCLLLLAVGAYAQSALRYELRYAAAGDSAVSIQITLPEPLQAPATLVIPRSYPGGYEQVPYDSFVEGVTALAPDGGSLAVAKDADGPRWALGKKGERVQRIAYRVDIVRMEAQIRDAVSSSKVRPRYAGLLGYSVFGFVDGFADREIELLVEGPSGWPVLTTLPAATAPDFDTLADSEILMGPGLKVSKLPGKIPLVMAIYSEGAVDAVLEGQLARSALNDVQAYFGDTPFPLYTVQLELLNCKPLPETLKTPVVSNTTCPGGQLLSAVWIAEVSSLPFGDSLI